MQLIFSLPSSVTDSAVWDILGSRCRWRHSGSSCSSPGIRSGSPESEPGGRGSIPPRLAASVAHHLGVDGAADAVGQLGVELGQLVAAVHARLGDVPDSSGLHDVPDVVFGNFDIAIK